MSNMRPYVRRRLQGAQIGALRGAAMSHGYPDGCTQAMHDDYYDANEERRIREQLATDIVDGWRKNPRDPAYKLMQEWVDDVMPDNGAMYACAILLGGDALAAATGTMWRDAVGWVADWIPQEEVDAHMEIA